ncbi:MAG: site-specific integrase [Bacteroidales bacterium]|jgi:integrase/recombinase XerD|nr:site-specific integrase [Bacteroidales bacterium]
MKYKFRIDTRGKHSNILLAVSINSKRSQQKIVSDINPDDWNQDQQKFIGKSKLTTINNLKLQKIQLELNQIQADIEVNELSLSISEIFTRLFNDNTKTVEFLMNKDHIENSHHYAWGTIKRHKSNLNVIHEYDKPVYFSKITYSWINELYTFLQDRGNSHNAIVTKFRFLKKYCGLAIRKGYLRKNPFSDYKIHEIDKDPVYLTPLELESLETFFVNMPAGFHRDILQMFLFFCFTGLRYSDWNKVTGQMIDAKVINVQMQKTSKSLNIPIANRAIKYVPDVYTKSSIFQNISDQYINRELKKIAKAAGIDKPISTKTARHSFSVYFLNRGGNLFALKNLLGHKKIESTLVYSRLVDLTLKDQISLID